MSATSWKTWDPKAFKAGNRRMLKLSRENLEAAIAASDRVRAESTAIRAKVELPPLEENTVIREARQKLAEGSGKPRKAKEALPPSEMVADLAKRRRKAERDRKTVDKAIGELVREKIVPASQVAKALGISRQRVYQLAS